MPRQTGRSAYVAVLRKITLTAVQEILEETEEQEIMITALKAKHERTKEELFHLKTLIALKDLELEELKAENGTLKKELEELKKARVISPRKRN